VICPPPDVLAAFAAGDLTAAEIHALEPHLDGCSACLGIVGHLGNSVGRTAEASAQLAPGVMVERYQVLSLVGRGAFGAVYAAYDPDLDRRIALKLVRHGRAEDEERFLREARAMARLASPHVVAVHDVGRVDAGLFIAMEFVDGETLGAWLAAEERSPAQIVEVFVQAARGLAAAHAAGIVHRDFKPENVLVHGTGRVAVTDFGLAGETSKALVGTPLYMAPEALARGAVDARSDLFSFCVALYAALYREHPFPAVSIAELTAAFAREPLPPRETKVPRHVRDAVLAGLRVDPAARPESMVALIRALEHDPRKRRIVVAGTAAGILAIVGALVLRSSASRAPPPDCRARARLLVDATWGAAKRTAVRAGIEASGSPLAHDAVGRVESALDRYSGAWQAGWVDACEADEARAIAPAIFARRRECLDRRRAQWALLVTALERPDDTTVLGASSAAYALPGVELCADPRWLATASSPQDDTRLTTAYAAIANAQVLADLGSTSAGLFELESPLALARRTGDRGLEAAARLVEGDLRRAVDPRAAEAPLHAAAIAASAVGRLDLEARAKILLVQTLAHSQLRLAESTRAADYAEAAVVHLADPALLVEYFYARGLAEWSAGGAERSLPLERLTLLTAIVVHGPEHPKVAEALNSIAVSFVEVDRIAESLPLQRAALAMRERLQGPSHPETLNARGNLALALGELGRIDEAVALQESVAADRATVLGADYFLLDETWIRLANLYQWELGRPEDALRAARRARTLDEAAFGADAPEGIASLSALARVLAAQGAGVEAVATSIRGMKIAQAKLPRAHPLARDAMVAYVLAVEANAQCASAMNVHLDIDTTWSSPRSGRRDRAIGLMSRARCAAAGGDPAQALHVLNRALELREQSRGAESPMIADVLIEIARVERGRGRRAEAELAARRAVAVRTRVPGLVLATAQLELARATGDRAGAELAQTWLRDHPTVPLAGEVARWLAAP
jgi:tRNA A-37 threonylcarbamoyl transferase component Bud32/tetratricopeptide (TPR) repeat protein